jgi:DNA-binding YbaB/EbfC family protein
MANMMQMMAKAQQFKSKMQEMQVRVQATDVDGQAGNGLVTCRVSGKFELKMLKIDPSVIDPNDKEMMEDLIVAAVNDARNKAEALMQSETEKLMKDMGLPPNLGLPF